MPPQDRPPEEQPKAPKRSPPPELAFLEELSKGWKQMEPEEKGLWARGLLQKIREHSEMMRPHGMDADLMISHLQPMLERFELAQKEVEEGEQKLLHAAADVAEAMRNLVDGLEAAIQELSEDKPFDPQVQEWKEMVEELRKECPRID